MRIVSLFHGLRNSEIFLSSISPLLLSQTLKHTKAETNNVLEGFNLFSLLFFFFFNMQTKYFKRIIQAWEKVPMIGWWERRKQAEVERKMFSPYTPWKRITSTAASLILERYNSVNFLCRCLCLWIRDCRF